MKDTILNSIVIIAAFSAILLAAIGDNGSASQQTSVVQAPRVLEMEKTVVAARRADADVTLVAFAGQ